jgi:hypothetical protein
MYSRNKDFYPKKINTCTDNTDASKAGSMIAKGTPGDDYKLSSAEPQLLIGPT